MTASYIEKSAVGTNKELVIFHILFVFHSLIQHTKPIGKCA